MAGERVGQNQLLEVRTPITIDRRFIDRYEHLWHLGSLALFEEERYRILEDKGVSANLVQKDYGLKIVVAKMKDAEWSSEVHEGDNVEIITSISNSHVIMFVHHEMVKRGIPAVKANYILAFTEESGIARRIPNEVLNALYGKNS